MQLSQQHQAQNVTSLFTMFNLLQFEVYEVNECHKMVLWLRRTISKSGLVSAIIK